MTPAIWQDMLTRMRNLRADMIGQWQGDLDNHAIESAVMALGSTIQVWQSARPETAAPQSITAVASEVKSSGA